ncbi:Caleosin related protein-domain-containing protein [Hypoxylon cercidicola]|nr:Caleosin related protein-domain-containing protein [Hypoxylon cercidicola]
MSAKHSQETRKPATEHVGQAQHVNSRSPVNHNVPAASTAGRGQTSQRHIEIALNHHANLGHGRRRMSAPGPDDKALHDVSAARTHRTPLHEKPGSNSSPRNNDNHRVPLPEKSPLRNQRRSAEAARPKQAPSREQPKGAVAGGSTDTVTVYTPGDVLQRNAEYFDVDRDGIVWPRDTYAGCRKLGWGITSSTLAVVALHSTLSYPTNPGSIPDVLSRIYYDASQNSSRQDKHDEKERSVPSQACEGILAKHDTNGKGGLNFRDVLRFWNEQRSQLGVLDWCTVVVECKSQTKASVKVSPCSNDIRRVGPVPLSLASRRYYAQRRHPCRLRCQHPV